MDDRDREGKIGIQRLQRSWGCLQLTIVLDVAEAGAVEWCDEVEGGREAAGESVAMGSVCTALALLASVSSKSSSYRCDGDLLHSTRNRKESPKEYCGWMDQ
jgi:hypothetical protein